MTDEMEALKKIALRADELRAEGYEVAETEDGKGLALLTPDGAVCAAVEKSGLEVADYSELFYLLDLCDYAGQMGLEVRYRAAATDSPHLIEYVSVFDVATDECIATRNAPDGAGDALEHILREVAEDALLESQEARLRAMYSLETPPLDD